MENKNLVKQAGGEIDRGQKANRVDESLRRFFVVQGEALNAEKMALFKQGLRGDKFSDDEICAATKKLATSFFRRPLSLGDFVREARPLPSYFDAPLAPPIHKKP